VRRAAFLIVLGLVAAGCGGSGSPSASENGPIVVSASADGKYGLFRRDRAGHLAQLTRNPHDFYAAVSPDGKRIAFQRFLGNNGSSQTYVMPIDGGEPRLLTSAPTGVGVSWNPDGDRIAFGDGRGGISVISVDGGMVTKLAPKGSLPAWSPDGDTIAFIAIPALYEMNADGTHRRVILDPAKLNSKTHIYTFESVDWSPDGRNIVFLKHDILAVLKPYSSTIDIANPDGSGERTVTRVSLAASEAVRPTWSPDGASIAYMDSGPSRDVDTYGLRTISTSGGKPSIVLRGIAWSYPDWGPAGT
jgi:Tol biopolymer transport system component